MVAAQASPLDGVAVLRLRGLPFNATHSDIVQFFEGFNVRDVLITRTYGKANGQAYVAIDAAQAPKAFAELNNKFMGKRYVEVFGSNVSDMETARRIIHLARHPDLRPTGEAYVALQTESELLAALKKHKSSMGKRYIEVFPSCTAEMQQALAAQQQQQQQQQQLLSSGQHTPFQAPGNPMVLPPVSMPSPSEYSKAWMLQQQQQQLVQQQLVQQQLAQQQAIASTPAAHEQLLLAALQQQQQQLAMRARAAAMQGVRCKSVEVG
ncbi:hypothetical protein OEZ86_005591 [Tetradesmus obliquus]|nr:hypothetical protein OEZ86_005591 [Tetradesmus obliquus]